MRSLEIVCYAISTSKATTLKRKEHTMENLTPAQAVAQIQFNSAVASNEAALRHVEFLQAELVKAEAALLATSAAVKAAGAAYYEATEPATETTVYPVRVGRGAAVHAASYIAGDFNEVMEWTACGTTSRSLNREVRRAVDTPVAITCTKCLKVDAARRR